MLQVANDSKIPVVTVDRNSNKGEVVSHIASDNVAGGKMAAEFILEKLGEKGNIVEIQDNQVHLQQEIEERASTMEYQEKMV